MHSPLGQSSAQDIVTIVLLRFILYCEKARQTPHKKYLTSAQVMSLGIMEVDPRKLHLWTRARGHLRDTWEEWRLIMVE